MPEAVIVPGLLAIDPQRWSGSGPALVSRGPLAGHAERVDFLDWKSGYTFTTREAAERHGIDLPTEVLDLSDLPLVRAQVDRSRLTLVADHHADRLAAAGELVIEMSYHRGVDGGGLVVRHGSREHRLDASDHTLITHSLGALLPDDGPERDEMLEGVSIVSLYDRILRAMTGGDYSLLDIDLALLCSVLPSQDLASLEREYHEIHERADGQRARASAICAALDAAEGSSTSLPGLGPATRDQAPAFRLSSDMEGYSGDPLDVPAATEWQVADVDAYMPAERTARIERFREERRADRTEAAERAQSDRSLMFIALGVATLIVLGGIAFGLL